MIFWVEPDEVQLADLKKTAAPTAAAKANQPPPIERCAQIIAELIRTQWTAEARPANAKQGQKTWATRLPKKQTGFSRSTNEAAYNLIASDPARFNLCEIGSGHGAFFIAIETAPEASPTAPLNPEQEDLF